MEDIKHIIKLNLIANKTNGEIRDIINEKFGTKFTNKQIKDKVGYFKKIGEIER